MREGRPPGSFRLTVSTTHDLAAVPGLPECGLSPADVLALPTASPPAPWWCRVQALVWLQYAPTPDFGFLRRPLPWAAVAVVHYLDTPVGGYHEILAGALVVDRRVATVQVPFIAVDSAASAHGGRVNWALPKTFADFDGDVGSGPARVHGRDWSVRVDVGRSGPALPARLTLASIGPVGRSRTVLRGRARPVAVRAEVQGPTIGRWLRSGRHLGVLLTGTAEVGAPTP